MKREAHKPSSRAFKRFQDFTRQLLRVPKEDLDQKRREYDEAKAKKRDEK